MKKTWEKPVLVVLVRGQSEETLIALCKAGYGIPGNNAPGTEYGNCRQDCGAVSCSVMAQS